MVPTSPAPCGVRVCSRYDEGSRRALSSDETTLVGGDDSLHTVSGPELGEHATDVRLHGADRNDEVGGDLRVAPAARKEDENLTLPRSEGRKGTAAGPGWSLGPEVRHHRRRHSRVEPRLPCRDGVHGGEQVLR